ncbi:MAG TPA: hypothetical protein VFU69_07935 [Ktedonobacterales bacterium]|nr:hypothetical protein [Ktedonobacterales bacterium]
MAALEPNDLHRVEDHARMPILPNPSPTAQHLIPPPTRPRGRLSGIVNASIAVIALLMIFFLGSGWLTNASFFLAERHLQAGIGTPGRAIAFQGFSDVWLRKWGDHQFTKPDSKQIMLSEYNDYHMNAVAIQVTADQARSTDTTLSYKSTDQGNTDSLPDQDIQQAITDAQAAGLTPILSLTLRMTQEPGTTSPIIAGNLWFNVPGQTIILNGTAATSEHQWIDSYTAFAVHYAQISQKYHLPYFIFGNDLLNLTTDTKNTAKGTRGATGSPGDKFTCSGRRDCDWRHVINAIKSASYIDYQGKQQTGGGYQGQLIYGAYWGKDDQAPPEFEHITWWDAVDFIGVDAAFPLTQNVADVPVATLIDAWHGKKDDLPLAGQGDIVGRLGGLYDKVKRPILFTSAGYESAPGANTAPGTIAQTARDDLEQEHDMEALLKALPQQTAPWFAGVIWSFDEPKWPRSSVSGWATSSAWAGDTVTGSGPNDAKLAGKFLAQFYQQRPISEE